MQWFLKEIKELIDIEMALEKLVFSDIDNELMLELKRKDFLIKGLQKSLM